MSKTKELLIKNGETLIGAKYKGSGITIPVYDDGFGPLFIHRDSMGVSGIVRAQTWEDAYSICEDEFFPDADETEEELIAEFGTDYQDNACFQEQYGYRGNTGGANGKRKSILYAKDLNGDSLDRLTREMLEDWGIELEIETEEEEEE